MNVLIIEDEHAAAENLKYLLNEIVPDIKIKGVLDSVQQSIDYLKDQVDVDLLFMDIHLADGLSFEIFNEVTVNIPVIFTTAYDEYAIKAFKVNSIDYLLKPNDEEELRNALQQFKNYQSHHQNLSGLKNILSNYKLDKTDYKKTYLVRQRDVLIPIDVNQIAYFIIETGIVKAITFHKQTYSLDKTMDELETEVNPENFFRANRQFIVHRKAIKNLQLYFNGKLILNIEPHPLERIMISKAKAPALRAWLDV